MRARGWLRREWLRRLALCAILILLVPACRSTPATIDAQQAISSGADSPLRADEARSGRALAGVSARQGGALYREYCVGCHGEKGDGNGPAARFLDPKPRDFTKGLFKFAGVASGELPRDEDLMRTLTRGLSGSSMPSWRLLPEESRRALLDYIKTLSPVWRRRASGTAIAISEDPFNPTDVKDVAAAIGRGRAVYHVVATCWQCHPAYAPQPEVSAMAAAEGKSEVTLRSGADRATPVKDSWGQQILPPDFTTSRLKTGSSLQDLYRTIGSGVGGTAMPTWKGSLDERDLWALVYYVKSLADRRWRAPRPVPSRQPESLAATSRR